MNRSLDAARAVSLRATALASCIACLSFAAELHAQTAPDAGSLLRESERQAPKLPVLPTTSAPKLLQDTGVKVVVTRFEVSGSTRYTGERLNALLADLIGKELGFAQIQAAADRVAALYRTDGLHATAFLPEQTLQDGLVRITVVEGLFGKLTLEPNADAPRLPLGLLKQMLAAGQTPGLMIDTRELERATLIANDVPGAQVSSVLTAGSAPGETDIVAQIEPRSFLSGLGSVDNADPRATGVAKFSASVGLASPGGWGDQAQFSGNVTEGKDYLRGAYELPLGALGWRAGVNASAMTYRLLGEFAATGAKGRSTTFGATTLYPVLRGVERNLYVTGSFDHRHLVNESDAGNLSDKSTDAFAVGGNGDATDALAGGGAMVYGLMLTVGKLQLDHNAADLAADAAGPRRDGHYAKLTGNLARLQRLSETGSLWLSVSGQYANKNLDSGEQFSLGGSSGVRAYPALEASGDQGWLATVEYRHHLSDAWQFTAFYDQGGIVREHSPQAGATGPNAYGLKGLGVGAVWRVNPHAVLHATAATRVGSNPLAGANGQDSDGTKRRPRFWLLAEIPF